MCLTFASCVSLILCGSTKGVMRSTSSGTTYALLLRKAHQREGSAWACAEFDGGVVSRSRDDLDDVAVNRRLYVSVSDLGLRCHDIFFGAGGYEHFERVVLLSSRYDADLLLYCGITH